MADLPDISPDFSQPLPQVDPNSDLVPYRMSRTDPDQGEVVTTGYGPRARPPIQPPGGGGVGVPDMTGFLGEALQHVPVEQAIQMARVAAQFIAQRGYMNDINNGKSAGESAAKWAPLGLFGTGAGTPEALQYQNAQAKAAQPTIRAVGGRLYRVPPITGQAEAISPEPSAPKMTPYQQAEIELRRKAAATPKPGKKSTITVPLDPANPEGAKISGPSDDPDVAAAVAKHEEFFKPKPPPPPAPSLVQRAKTALGIGAPATPIQPAISPQEFVPDTSMAAPPPARLKQPIQGDVPAGADLPNPARRKQPTQGAQTESPLAPPKAQRKVGTTYKTPKGLYTWTETGWVKADNAK